MSRATELSAELKSRVETIAPGFYTERDGGDWYCVTPTHDERVGEDFNSRDDARRLILWLAGDSLPEGWKIIKRPGIACDLDCGQGYAATIWTRPACRLFPGRAADLLP